LADENFFLIVKSPASKDPTDKGSQTSPRVPPALEVPIGAQKNFDEGMSGFLKIKFRRHPESVGSKLPWERIETAP